MYIHICRNACVSTHGAGCSPGASVDVNPGGLAVSARSLPRHSLASVERRADELADGRRSRSLSHRLPLMVSK